MRRKTSSVYNSRKGMMGEIVLVIVFLAVFGIIAVVGYQVFTDLNTDLQADADVSSDVKATAQDLHDRYPSTLDGAFITILGLLWVFGLVAAFFSDTHPVFLIVVVILIIFSLLAAAMLSNTWEEFTDDSELTSFSDNFPMTNYVLDHFLLVFAAIGISILLAAYMKNKVS